MKPSLVFTLLITLTFSTIAPAITLQDSITGLTNQDILTMVRAKLPSSLIIEKINSSSCVFDTFPGVLAELKYKGVPDDVMMAMVKAPHGARKATEPSAAKSLSGAEPTSSTESVPGVVARSAGSAPVTNVGGMILTNRSESP